MSFDPYLMYSRNCGEAFTRYQQIFGGELFVMRMGDAPGNEQVPADQADLVIHAALTIDGRVLMGSDDPSVARRSSRSWRPSSLRSGACAPTSSASAG